MKKPIKVATMCYVLLKNGPSTRIPLMRTVHVLENSKTPFRPSSNISYFLPTNHRNCRGCKDKTPAQQKKCWCQRNMHRDDAKRSILVKGLAEVVGKVGNSFVYGLTAKGRKLALEAAKFYGE